MVKLRTDLIMKLLVYMPFHAARQGLLLCFCQAKPLAGSVHMQFC